MSRIIIRKTMKALKINLIKRDRIGHSILYNQCYCSTFQFRTLQLLNRMRLRKICDKDAPDFLVSQPQFIVIKIPSFRRFQDTLVAILVNIFKDNNMEKIQSTLFYETTISGLNAQSKIALQANITNVRVLMVL